MFGLTDEQDALRKEVRAFAAKEVAAACDGVG